MLGLTVTKLATKPIYRFSCTARSFLFDSQKENVNYLFKFNLLTIRPTRQVSEQRRLIAIMEVVFILKSGDDEHQAGSLGHIRDASLLPACLCLLSTSTIRNLTNSSISLCSLHGILKFKRLMSSRISLIESTLLPNAVQSNAMNNEQIVSLAIPHDQDAITP